MNLRDALLQRLGDLAGTRRFHIHVLVSSPKKHARLYPYATMHPKTFVQHLLVLLSEQASADGPRVLVSGIEAFVYQVPSTSSGILYVSKVDSTGQAKMPSPTPTLVRGLMGYYVDPETRPMPVTHLRVHLFARAQNQYLFPNSSEYAGKRPLTDMKLCAWWKRQMEQVAEGVQGRAEVRLYHLLPGLGEEEAKQALGRGSGATTGVGWTYGHGYGKGGGNIGEAIPWFEDDPKARFLDEIAHTTEEGVRRVGMDEFWERMSFRQECVAGAVTGFFVMDTTGAAGKGASSGGGEGEGGEGDGVVSGQLVERVVCSLVGGHEFSSVERAVWSTRVLEEAIEGLCGNEYRHVYGTVSVANADAEGRRQTSESVTVLAVRRKKRN